MKTLIGVWTLDALSFSIVSGGMRNLGVVPIGLLLEGS